MFILPVQYEQYAVQSPVLQVYQLTSIVGIMLAGNINISFLVGEKVNDRVVAVSVF